MLFYCILHYSDCFSVGPSGREVTASVHVVCAVAGELQGCIFYFKAERCCDGERRSMNVQLVVCFELFGCLTNVSFC